MPTGTRDGSFMPAGPNPARLERVNRKWLDLAERRLAYYEELYRNGRWGRYFPTEEQFAVRMLDVIKAVKTFRQVVARAAEGEHESRVRPAA
jgi:hypothetical protein